MDSGNSGSMQSSSGGDEEYDSRAESISSFFNNPSLASFITNPPPPSQVHQTHLFDPLSNYFDSAQRTPNPPLNLDMMWSKPGRSEPNSIDLGSLMPSSSSAQNQPLFFSSTPLAGQTRTTAFPAVQYSLAPESGSRAANDELNKSTGNDNNINCTSNNVVRNPKKRSRASRRAPTTVLTTDTTNFRAMVQEFTGIPAQPFTSSPFPRTRLDLFGSSTIRSTPLDPPTTVPSYLLRPFAQKVQLPQPFVSLPPSSSSSIPSLPTSSMVETTLASNLTNSSSNNSTSINHELYSSDLGLEKQPAPQNLLSMNIMHNPSLNFQSMLQQGPPKYPLGNSSIMGTNKPQAGSLEIAPSADHPHLKMGVLGEFGLTHSNVNNANVGGLQNIVSSSSHGALSSRVNVSNIPASNWAEDNGRNNYSNTEQVTNGKIDYSASSDFHGDKGPECAAARSEGMVELWINCSSDN